MSEEIETLNLQELDVDSFNSLPDSGGGKTDYEQVWKEVEGKAYTSAGFDQIVAKHRKAVGLSDRSLYYAERSRVFKSWEEKGRKILHKSGTFMKNGRNVKMAVYRFIPAAPKPAAPATPTGTT